MANKYYSGTTHTFYSDFGDTVYIRAKQGQSLVIDGTTTGSVEAGDGLDKVGNVLNVLPDELSLEINEDNQLQIATQGIITGMLMDSCVTNEKLQQNKINIIPRFGLVGGGNAELGTSVTIDAKVDNASVEISEATNSIQVKNGGVTNAKLTNSAVTVSPGDGISGGGAVSLGSSVTLSVDSSVFRTSGGTLNGDLVINGTVSGRSNSSRYGFYYRNGAASISGDYPFDFNMVGAGISGITRNDPYVGAYKNTSGVNIVLLVSYSVRWSAVSGSENFTFISQNQPLSGGQSTWSKPPYAQHMKGSGTPWAPSSACVLNLAPNDYFTFFVTGTGTVAADWTLYPWMGSHMEFFRLL